jgi:group II intron reverse transcriptase/maturase
MCGHSSHGNRETSGRNLRGSEAADAEAPGKAESRNPGVHPPEESDGNMVPEKSANKGEATPAESMEGKTPAERNSGQEAASRAQNRESASIGLARVRQRAEADKCTRFNNLFHFLKVDLLRASFYELKRKAAPGMDGVTWQAYEQTLEERLPELERELHIGSYRATPARREYITKDDGRQRPLGVMTVEDKVVQQACVTILNEVFEPMFSGYSYGSRPGRSQHDALDALHEGVIRRKISWILDCDVEGFFDNLLHEHLLRFIEERVTDKRMLRLLRKWLRVGWIEDGKRHPGTIGTPQGSVISPLMANIFLNVVLDRWVSEWRRTQAKGDVIIVRYVDDVVLGFQYEFEGRAFLEALRERLKAFELTLHPTKTRLVEFGRFAASNRRKRGQSKPETFDFLGFKHICGVTRRGKFCIRRKTIAKRLRRKLKEVKSELVKRMHNPLESTGAWLASVIRGFTNYNAVPYNMKAPREFYTQVVRMWLWVIRRRSQKARGRWTWERFQRLYSRWLPRPRLVHPFPGARFDAKYSR